MKSLLSTLTINCLSNLYNLFYEIIQSNILKKYILNTQLPIIEYLNETRPGEVNLIPTNPYHRAKAREIAEIINSGIQPYQNLNVIKRVAKDNESNKKNWIDFYLGKGAKVLESVLSETSGVYSIGK